MVLIVHSGEPHFFLVPSAIHLAGSISTFTTFVVFGLTSDFIVRDVEDDELVSTL